MTREKSLITTLLCVIFWIGLPTQESLEAQVNRRWLGRKSSITMAFRDIKATRRGDLLMIVINEQSDVENLDRRQMDKIAQSSTDADANLGFSGFVGNSAGGGTFDSSSNGLRRYNGNAIYQSERGFLDRFTVQVLDELPNGNLLIGGKRYLNVEGDPRELWLTGIIRSVDVAANNTITSQNIADMNLRYVSGPSGNENKFFNQGWLSKRINRIWPY